MLKQKQSSRDNKLFMKQLEALRIFTRKISQKLKMKLQKLREDTKSQIIKYLSLKKK